MIVYSLIPVVLLYLGKDAPLNTNEHAVKLLENKKGEYFEFIMFGDNRAGLILCDSATLKIIRRINREDRFKKAPVDFVAVLGDIVFTGSRWDYRIYNKLRSSIKWPVISVEGDHEGDNKSGPEDFKKYIGKSEISFGTRNSYFITLDNKIGDLNDEQFTKLEHELNVSLAYKHRFIFMHKPPFSPYQQSWYRPESNLWAYRFMKLCEKYKVDIVFCGHEHMFKEAIFGGVKYIISAGGGVPTQIPDSEGGFLHYVVVRVYGDYTDYEVRKVFPPLWEYLTYYFWKDAFYLLKDTLF